MKPDLEGTLYLDNWPLRRRYMTAVLAWALMNAQYIVVFGDDTALNQNAFYALVGLVVMVIGSYVFGATWDDSDKRKRLADKAKPE